MSGAIELAPSIRGGARSAREVVDEHLAVVDARDDELHACNLVTAESARAAADAVDAAVARGEDPGPLAGVPIVLKDNLCTRGVPTTCSSKILEGWCPPYTATVVDRVLAAGAVPVAKTNLDEFAMGSSTENSAFGPTRNPRDPSRVPGGSSGGSAAAVAAGYAPLGLGSDTGGSIRQPASMCGVVGVKPTYGLVSRYGLIAFASSLDQIGPFATTVSDAALLLDAIAGHDPMDSTSIPSPYEPVVPVLERGVDGLRIAIVDELVEGEGFQPEVLAAVDDAARALEKAGATVDRVSVPSVRYGLSAYYVIAPAEASSNLARYDGVRYGLRVDGQDVATMNARHARRRLRSRGEAAHHARHLRAVRWLLRRVLRTGAARPDAHHPRLRPRRTSSTTRCCRPRRRRWRSSSGRSRPTRWRCTSPTSAPSPRTWPATPRSACPTAPARPDCRSGCRCWPPRSVSP